MGREAEIIKRLRDKIWAEDAYEIFVATVQSVDEEALTIDVLMGEDEEEPDVVPGVRLRASTDAPDGLIVIPEIESTVLIAAIEGAGYYCMLMASKVAKVKWAVGDMNMLFGPDEIVFNNGDNEGLVIVTKLVERLNKLEEALADLITKYNSHTHVTSCGAGPGSATATPTKSTKVVTNTVQEDIENPLIKH